MRIEGDRRENERRINEEVNRQGRRQKLLYEAESSARANATVAMKWSALFDKEIPQELLAEIELQRETCERIIESKVCAPQGARFQRGREKRWNHEGVFVLQPVWLFVRVSVFERERGKMKRSQQMRMKQERAASAGTWHLMHSSVPCTHCPTFG